MPKDKAGKWININGEAVYGTTEWEVTHEGPTKVGMEGTNQRQLEGFGIKFTPKDFWFTRKGKKIYAIALEYPEKEALIESLGSAGSVKSVKMLGSHEKLVWSSTREGLKVALPAEKPNKNGYVLEISLK